MTLPPTLALTLTLSPPYPEPNPYPNPNRTQVALALRRGEPLEGAAAAAVAGWHAKALRRQVLQTARDYALWPFCLYFNGYYHGYLY